MGNRPLSPAYRSGSDFVVEVEGARLRYSAQDFAERVGDAAVRMGVLTRAALGPDEAEDLVALAAHGRVARPASGLAAHLERHRGALLEDGTLVHWLRRLVVRGAWIDQQVADGRIRPVWDEVHGFRYRTASQDEPTAEEPPLPDWSAIAYRGAEG
jgi:hypothetical protein